MNTINQTKLPPSNHPFAEIVHRLEAGQSMLPDTPEKPKTNYWYL